MVCYWEKRGLTSRMEAGSWEYRKNGNLDKQERELGEKDIQQLCRLVEVGARDVQGLPLLAQPAPRQSYTPMAGKATPSSHEPPRQWRQVPVTLIYQWKNKGGEGWG